MSSSGEGVFGVFCSSLTIKLNYFIVQGDGISPLVQTSVLGKGVKHRPPPIKMPSGSGSSSSGTFDKHENYDMRENNISVLMLFFLVI